MWFFKVPVVGQIRPWIPTSIVSVVTFVFVSFWLWPEMAWQILVYTAISIGVIVAIVGIGVAIATLIRWLDNHFHSQLVWTLVILFTPIWGPFWVLITLHEYLQNTGFYVWYITTRKWWIVTPWSVTMLALVTISFLTLGAKTTWMILGIIGAIVFAIAFAVAIVVGIIFLVKSIVDSFRERTKRRSKSIVRQTTSYPTKPSSNTVQVIVAGIKAKKRKICPLINLPYDPELDEPDE